MLYSSCLSYAPYPMLAITLESVSKSFFSAKAPRGLFTALLHKSECSTKAVLSGFSLSVDAGQKVLVVGPNGSGKTTLLKIIAGLLAVDSGRLLFGAQKAGKWRRRDFGLMLSNCLLYDGMTGYQNLEYTAHLYGCKNIQSRISRAAELWGIDPFLDLSVGAYSNGMKTSLALARAMIPNPPLLLLDEPTSFLDSEGIGRLREFLRTSPHTVILTSQQPELLETRIDRIVSL